MIPKFPRKKPRPTPTPLPTIALSDSSLGFNATEGGSNPVDQTVTITNSGGGSFAGLQLGTTIFHQGTGWLSSSILAGIATIVVTVGSLTAATYNADVPVRDANATNSPQTISVSFVVGAPGA